MWYFLVIAFKHLEIQRQMQLSQFVFDKLKSHPVHLLVKEYGKEGTSPHFNLITETDKESTAKSFRQVISRFFTKSEITDYTLKGKFINNKIQLANVVCGYLQKEQNAEILQIKGIDTKDLQKLQQKKIISINETYKPITTPYLYDLCINYYKQHVTEPFSPKVFKEIILYLNKSHNITTNIKQLHHMYLSLDGNLGNGNKLREYLDEIIF